MVVGNGLIARAFDKYKNSDNIIIFASGVSNSKEERNTAFIREMNLLSNYFDTKSRLIYFSTCSIDDPSLKNSEYIAHKIRMEKVIKRKFPNNIIFRLPNVVGSCENPNTSFNYFKTRIKENLPITIEECATRYLIDSDDLSILLPYFIEKDIDENVSQTINVVLDNKIYVKDMIKIMEEIIGKDINKTFISKGLNYSVDNKFFTESLFDFGAPDSFIKPENYNYNLIKKYLS